MANQSNQANQSRSESQKGNQNASGSGQDRNNDGKGRGNFGNAQQHAEAGKQSGAGTATAVESLDINEVAQQEEQLHQQDQQLHSQGLGQLRSLMENLQKDRQYHQQQVEDIDKAFMEIRGEIDTSNKQPQQNGGAKKRNAPQAKRKGGDGRQDSGNRGGRGQTRSTRNGEETGTMSMIKLLEQNNGRMSRKDLREQSGQAGVSSPYSSLYSLERSGKVTREGDEIVLVQDSNTEKQAQGSEATE
jgi:hypothetical protein